MAKAFIVAGAIFIRPEIDGEHGNGAVVKPPIVFQSTHPREGELLAPFDFRYRTAADVFRMTIPCAPVTKADDVSGGWAEP